MVAPKIYYSTDSGAPVLNGNAGSFINVLDACLVNGYGSKPAAGWTKAFSGTNVAAYRMGTTNGANRHFLRVRDDGVLLGGSVATMHGYANMTDVNTGTFIYPIAGQTSYTVLRKSSSNDSVARPWAVFATSSAFYVFVEWEATVARTTFIELNRTSNNTSVMFFGEYTKYYTGHSDNVAIISSHYISNTGQFGGIALGQANPLYPNWSSDYGRFIARAPYGTNTPLPFEQTNLKPLCAYYDTRAQLGFSRGTGGTLPDVISGATKMSAIEILTSYSGRVEIIGKLPGYYAIAYGAINELYVGPWVVPSGPLAGRTFFTLFQVVALGAGSSGTGSVTYLDCTDW